VGKKHSKAKRSTVEKEHFIVKRDAFIKGER
jgi:hypothetical protein